jgi:3-dehydroquinate synthase
VTFHQPKLVLVDPRTVHSLTERQFRTGLAEVVKYGVIRDGALFRLLEKEWKGVLGREPRLLARIVSRSCSIKSAIVSQDEKETGKRAWLNYGHTLGHALESYFGYRGLTHGEAIAFGMHFAALLSYRLRLCGRETVDRQYALLDRIGLFRTMGSFDPERVRRKMSLDKKARKDGIQFVLTRKIGLVTIRKNVPEPHLFSALSQIRAEMTKSR